MFVAVGPAMGAVLFALVFAVFGVFNMGIGAPLAAVFYSAWMLPWLYFALALPFLFTGIAYAVAARRHARPSLLVALVAGAGVFTAYLCLLHLFAMLANAAGLLDTATDGFTMAEFPSNLATLAGTMAIGVPPSWWLVRDRGARLRWI